MSGYLLLTAAGAFWICGIVGVCVLYHLWRSGRRGVAGDDSPCDESKISAREDKADCQSTTLPASAANDSLPPLLPGFPSGTSEIQGLASGSSPLRFPYRHRQWMAACVQDRLPEADDFVAIECRELFGDGVSFYSDSMCSAGTLVITLGTPDRPVFMLARVISEVSKASGSPAAFLVECRFIRRVRENTSRWARALTTAHAVQSA